MSLLLVSDFFVFKQKTAYEMRIIDWSSDVCSSDLEILEGHRFGAVDRLRDRAVDIVLRRRLHREVVARPERLRVDEGLGQRRVREAGAVEGIGVVCDLDRVAGAVRMQDVAGMAEAVAPLYPGGDAVGEQRRPPRPPGRGGQGGARYLFLR